MEARKGAFGPLELGVTAIVSHPLWVLGSELLSTGRSLSELTPPVPFDFIFWGKVLLGGSG